MAQTMLVVATLPFTFCTISNYMASFQKILSCVSAFCVFLFFFIIFKSSTPRPVEQAPIDDGLINDLHVLHVRMDTFRKITAKRYGDKVPQPIYNDVRVIPFVETLDKVHISVKSTKKYHLSRVPLLLLTWFQTIPPKNVSPLAISESSLLIYLVVFNY